MSCDRRVVHLHGRSLNMPGMDSFPQLLAVPMILCLVGFRVEKGPCSLRRGEMDMEGEYSRCQECTVLYCSQ